MLSRNQINIMASQLFQAQKMLIKLFNRNRLPDFSPRKPLVLAKNTGQTAIRKENGSASLASGNTGFLPKMRSCSTDMHDTSRMTKSPLTFKAIHLTFPWAKSTGSIGKNTLLLSALNRIGFFFLYYISFFFPCYLRFFFPYYIRFFFPYYLRFLSLYYIRFLFLNFIYFLYLRHFRYVILIFPAYSI